MESQKPGFGRRAASVAGKAGAHVGKKSAAYFGRYVILPIVVTLAIFAGFTWILLPNVVSMIASLPSAISTLIRGPQLPPKLQLEKAEKRCALTAALQDGRTKIEKLGAAMATINLAESLGLTTCQVYNGYKTLAIPGGKVLAVPRSSTLDYQAYVNTDSGLAQYNVGRLALEECANDLDACFQKYPWLKCVKYEIRNTWKYAFPPPDWHLRSDERVKRVYPEHPKPGEAEFFCPA
jgi:hypothetical protein